MSSSRRVFSLFFAQPSVKNSAAASLQAGCWIDKTALARAQEERRKDTKSPSEVTFFSPTSSSCLYLCPSLSLSLSLVLLLSLPLSLSLSLKRTPSKKPLRPPLVSSPPNVKRTFHILIFRMFIFDFLFFNLSEGLSQREDFRDE